MLIQYPVQLFLVLWSFPTYAYIESDTQKKCFPSWCFLWHPWGEFESGMPNIFIEEVHKLLPAHVLLLLNMRRRDAQMADGQWKQCSYLMRTHEDFIRQDIAAFFRHLSTGKEILLDQPLANEFDGYRGAWGFVGHGSKPFTQRTLDELRRMQRKNWGFHCCMPFHGMVADLWRCFCHSSQQGQWRSLVVISVLGDTEIIFG